MDHHQSPSERRSERVNVGALPHRAAGTPRPTWTTCENWYRVLLNFGIVFFDLGRNDEFGAFPCVEMGEGKIGGES